MSTLEKAHPVEQAWALDASHKFHLELSVTNTQIRNIECAVGTIRPDSPINTKAFGTIENCFLTGSARLLENIPELVSKL
jgi:hypothetical protein